MISADEIKTEPDDNTNEKSIEHISNSNVLQIDDTDNLSISQDASDALQNVDEATAIFRPTIKEWLVNGLVHCPKCKKTKQIPYAFRRPSTCQICKVNYVNQCAICKKKFTKFKTLRLHLQQFKCGKQRFKEDESSSLKYIKHEPETIDSDIVKELNPNESFQEIKLEVKEENDGNLYNTDSRLHLTHEIVESRKGLYACKNCNKVYKNKYRKNSHEKYCDQLRCERCNFKAVRPDQLREHMKAEHSTVDPNDYFKCSKCDKPFTDKYVKNKHEKYCGLELNLKCTHCYYETTRIERLQAHIQTTHISLVPQF